MSSSERTFGVSEPSEFTRILGAIADTFRRAGLRWYVFGAQAVIVYGRPRLTADLDITVLADLDHVPHLVESLAPAGLVLQPIATDDFVRRTRVLPFVHESTGIPVDIVLAGPGLEQEFAANAREIDLGGVSVPVISPEDLIVTKILVGRPKDLDDVDGILRAQPRSMDLQRSRRFLAMLEEALTRDDLLLRLDEAVSRAAVTNSFPTGDAGHRPDASVPG
jgi:hypothetical protein